MCLQHNTCPVCRFQLPADPNHRVQPQAVPPMAPPSPGASGSLDGAPSGGSDMFVDFGDLFGGHGPAQLLSSLTAALSGMAGGQPPPAGGGF